MLDCLESKPYRLDVYRLASYNDDRDVLLAMGITDDGDIEDMEELFHASSLRDVGNTLLDAPFRSRHQLWRRRLQPSRFSDGTVSVFYASLDVRTSEEEQKYWFARHLPSLPHGPYYYWRFRCRFEGTAKDLRSMKSAWPDLVHSTDYTFCNKLGAEATRSGLDALLAPSVRRAGGTNLPVFARRALSNVDQLEMVSLTVDPSSRSVVVVPVNSR